MQFVGMPRLSVQFHNNNNRFMRMNHTYTFTDLQNLVFRFPDTTQELSTPLLILILHFDDVKNPGIFPTNPVR